MLHTVNKSPFEKNSLLTCLRLSAAGSSILMTEDGIYGALKGTQIESLVSSGLADRKIFVLGPDLKARGIEEERLIDGIAVVDYAGFVELAATNSGVQSWL